MAITRNYSGPALIASGVICILLAFVGKLSAFVGTIPVFVSGGLAIYLFGVIGMQGIALMQESLSEITRATISPVPPAAYGTMRWTLRLGYVCAVAVPATVTYAAASIAIASVRA